MASSSLVIGSSGSGKTSLAKDLASRYDSLVVVNGSGFPNAVECDYEAAEGLAKPGGMVVFDDVIRPTPEQLAVIKRFLLYVKRHNNVEVLVLAHSVKSNNTYSLLQHFDFVICTKAGTNAKNFKDVCQFAKVEGDHTWKAFLTHREKNVYLKVDMTSGECQIIETKMTAERELAEKKRGRVLAILTSLGGSPDLAMQLFDHIFASFDIAKLHDADLSLAMTDKGKKKAVKVNICDLLHFATTPDTTPTPESTALFIQFQARFSIPTAFLKNDRFKEQVRK